MIFAILGVFLMTVLLIFLYLNLTKNKKGQLKFYTKYVDTIFSRSKVRPIYKWYVTGLITLSLLMLVLAIIYILYMSSLGGKLFESKFSLNSIMDAFNLYRTAFRSYVIIYTFLLIGYALITSYAYMTSDSDFESYGIKQLSDMWIGEKHGIIGTLISKWWLFFVFLILKPHIVSASYSIFDKLGVNDMFINSVEIIR
jgi:hypothetical protein